MKVMKSVSKGGIHMILGAGGKLTFHIQANCDKRDRQQVGMNKGALWKSGATNQA